MFSLNGFLDFLSAIHYLTAEKVTFLYKREGDSVLYCRMKKKENFAPRARTVGYKLCFIQFPTVHGLKLK